MQTVEFQGRTFQARETPDGLQEVRYLHEGRNVAGSVASRDPARLPELLRVQSAVMGGTQLLPR